LWFLWELPWCSIRPFLFPLETAKDKILHRVKRRSVVFFDTFDTLEIDLEACGHRRFGVLFDFQTAAFFRALFTECSKD
jgi:hypothetical protein